MSKILEALVLFFRLGHLVTLPISDFLAQSKHKETAVLDLEVFKPKPMHDYKVKKSLYHKWGFILGKWGEDCSLWVWNFWVDPVQAKTYVSPPPLKKKVWGVGGKGGISVFFGYFSHKFLPRLSSPQKQLGHPYKSLFIFCLQSTLFHILCCLCIQYLFLSGITTLV